MSVTRTVRPETAHAPIASTQIPPVPLTIEGYSVLHQMMRLSLAGLAVACAGAEDRDHR